ncbi:hypothetical protein AAC387_Pa01g2568 [Persea americana]|eukprot:TRINITY_DN5157_c0_g1_i1.p1 TRINITY_DN5157_c0_g1~~TRINITY_DN5157_c0_g1_i1.p1  ORF type:complete len:418 (+),score=78.14 TRINITY_DN5157_c0_g1_i1:726-1979(+)
MEAFSLLKYWRGGGGGGAAANAVRNPASTTITSSVPRPAEEHDDEDDEEEEEEDEGSFFDLEFTVPDDTDDRDEDDGEGSIETDEDRDFDFTVSSAGSDGCRTDPNLTLSPSDDLFFKGKLVQVEPSSIVYNSSEPNSRTQFPVSLLKSATKFRVFLLGFKKPKPPAEAAGGGPAPKQPSRFFTVKFKVEEVPIVSLFTRDNSSRSSNAKPQKQQQPLPPSAAEEEAAGDAASADAKRFAKVVMQKYLKMIKPLYVKVSRRYGEKLRFSGQLSLGLGKASTAVVMQEAPAAEVADGGDAQAEAIAPATEAPATVAPPANAKQQKQGNLPAGLRVVCKHLGKSRSASAAIVAAPQLSSQRRDDSLLQQQDGIQSAIAHCKRSFNASTDSLEEISLPRSSSDSRGGKSVDGCLGNSIKG